MIELKNLTYAVCSKKEERTIINNISFVFPNSGIASIIGPSGSGKSTLLNLIEGKIHQTSGKIEYKISQKEISRIERFPHCSLSCREYLHLMCTNNNFDEVNKMIEETYSSLPFYHLLDKKLSELSEGERSVLSFASWRMKPSSKVFLIDEPLAYLSSENKRIIEDDLIESSKNHLIILTVHPETKEDEEFINSTKVLKLQ